MTANPKGANRRATACPMRPVPRSPTVVSAMERIGASSVADGGLGVGLGGRVEHLEVGVELLGRGALEVLAGEVVVRDDHAGTGHGDVASLGMFHGSSK